MHIGLIGGIGPAATEYYYRGMVARHKGRPAPLELTIVHAHAPTLARNAAAGAAETQAAIFAGLTGRLKASGAGVAAVTSIGGHFCINELAALSPLPLLNAIPAIDAEIKRRGIRRIGLLGTRNVMAGRLYGGLTSSTVVVPEGDALERAGTNYVSMALSGAVTAPCSPPAGRCAANRAPK
jgi:aspartate racemase